MFFYLVVYSDIAVFNGKFTEIFTHLLSFNAVFEQFSDSIRKKSLGKLRFLNEHGGACVAQNLCVFILMVICYVRRRYEYRRLFHHGKLGKEHCSGTVDDKIRRSHLVWHVVYIIDKLKIFKPVKSRFFKFRSDRFIVSGSG